MLTAPKMGALWLPPLLWKKIQALKAEVTFSRPRLAWTQVVERGHPHS